MNELYLDIGNSFLKLATQHGESWQLLYDGRTNTVDSLVKVIKKSEQPVRLYVSSVRKDLFRDLNESLGNIPVRLFDVSDIPGGKLDYHTPETFGFDRFLVC
ncbi:MAG: type III pantothenate kinase, partial [Bacteroidetes bacterium]|nr:type III pantothenate kinase [Bacteroidota bacterium]